jgi:hypothetical protein
MEEIRDWKRKNSWSRGTNYLPRTAVNPLEMWHKDTWSPEVIDQELGWAQALGFNAMRVFLHNLVWENEGEEYLKRFDTFLGIAARHGIKTMPVLFDGVWNPVGTYGRQPPPHPNRHNSGWTQCPTGQQLADPRARPALEAYVRAFLERFGKDERVYLWDLYNEPDNTNDGRFSGTEPADKAELAFALAKETFDWAEKADPIQPWTVGIWRGSWTEPAKLGAFETMMLERSPVVSFHCYGPLPEFRQKVEALQRYDKPLVCSEYMARNQNNSITEMLPLLKAESVDAFNWGFVSGKSQTIYPWDSWKVTYTSEPEVWFHDLLRPDGSPYRKTETDLIAKLCREQ